ncbi:alpha/beta fold hydrolase [Nocardioides iriomotensis]|uniref:Alpha/beta hydrolase n=1 Tax=Nocardioides iriomotensis TaxID=715784 RepID=A0A4Q5J9Q0_9ACTN|nr:alpha/beta hydrolase [Nocardioides iriomotensis]RYU14591.1 alpha/beta hydrolase [Nocardioides iriomotensis]
MELPGPWSDRYVAANGARFHCVEAGPADGPLVLLLHGFPQFWWAWRAQLPALADAGYRAVAMDLRGYGGSDKTPNGYDPVTLAGDVSGVVKALGERSAVLVGHGWGGYVAWATATLHPREVSALGAVAAPHPGAMLRGLRRHPASPALRHVLAMQVPLRPERRLARADTGFLRDHLRSWSSPASAFPDDDTVTTYQRAISQWPSSHCALEYHRWLVRSQVRTDGRAFERAMRAPVGQPVLVVRGSDDRTLPPGAFEATPAHVLGHVTEHDVAGAGHFVPEEAPDAFTALLLDWLSQR